MDAVPIRDIVVLFGGSWLAKKLLSPTLNYLGEEIKLLTQRRIENLTQVIISAEKKLGSREVRQVSPRVMKGLIREASFYDDTLSAEYFGGVLATSATGASRDDRGSVVLGAIHRLSAYQLRSHYILYHALRRSYRGRLTADPTKFGDDRIRMPAFIEAIDYMRAMAFDPDETERHGSVITSALAGLARESLIQSDYAFGDPARLSWAWKIPTQEVGVFYLPTIFGCELFLWAYGLGDLHPHDFVSSGLELSPIEGIEVPQCLGCDQILAVGRSG